MLTVQDWLIGTRFMTTMGHFVALMILFSTIPSNVNVGLNDGAPQSDYDQAFFTSQSALIFGSFCFGLDFFGMFFGTSLFTPSINLMQVIFHFIGGIFLSWLITDNWNYRALWPIVISTNVPTAVVEGCMLILVFGLKVKPF